MNYNFTAILVILLCLLAFFMEPGYIPIRCKKPLNISEEAAVQKCR